ncbi:MAG: DUF4423 domain-containing protein, partial [Bdellovibrionales bacterium]|nr:DUF4423 domain-containing protein [Bdellovibrionales bacterium]
KLAHMEELDIAKSKIEKVDLEKRYYRSNTFTVAKKDLPKLKKIIDKMNAETNKVTDISTPEEVYVLSCQLFPLTNCESISKSLKGSQHVH